MEKLGEILRRLREKAGYPSSRRFFNDHGGRKFFGSTYRQYMNVENGHSVPSPALLRQIIVALGLAHSQDAGAFAAGYLRSLGFDEDTLKLFVSTLSHAPRTPAEATSLVRSFARVNQERGLDVSREQFDFLSARFENYWTFTILANDHGAWTPAQLASTIGVSQTLVRRSLAKLLQLGLVRKDASGHYRSPYVGKVIRLPNSAVFPTGFKALRQFKDKMARTRGETLWRFHFTSRGSESHVRQYIPYLVQAVKGAEVCSVQQKGPDTVYFEVESIVRRLLPF